MAAGMTLSESGRRLGWTRHKASRVERGQVMTLSLDAAVRYASVLGLRLRVRAYPLGAPVRDVAQLAATRRFRSRLGEEWHVTLEVPLAIPGDLRAFDLVLHRGAVRIYVEVITRLTDAQAQLRAIHLKHRDSGGGGRLLVVVAESKHNRHALGAVRGLMCDEFPVSSRLVWAALAEGRYLGGNAIVVV
jgi:hypothetical protein